MVKNLTVLGCCSLRAVSPMGRKLTYSNEQCEWPALHSFMRRMGCGKGFEGVEARAPQVTPQVTGEVTGEVLRLLNVMTGELKRSEIQEKLSLRHEDYFREKYLIPTIEAGMIEMTVPDKPRSSKQKYRITDAGRNLLGTSL